MPNVPVPAAAEGTPSARSLDSLLTEFLDNQRLARACRLSADAIEDQLPDWVKPDPMRLYNDGVIGGPICGWPQVAVMPEPPASLGSFRKIRRGIRETWNDCTVMLPRKEDGRWAEERRRLRLLAFGAVRKVIARVRERDAVREASGVEAAYRKLDDISDRSNDLEDLIVRQFGTDRSVEALAVTIVFHLRMEMNTLPKMEDHGGIVDIALKILERFLCDLTGVLRVIVDDLMTGGDKTYYQLLIGGGWPLDGCYSPGDESVNVVARQSMEEA